MKQELVWEGNTAYGHYQVVDTLYDGRPARVLYSGNKQAAQSGIATDDKPDLLFDYNQRMFELTTNLNPKTVLLIGGAVGTLPLALLKALPSVCIDMIEPDAGLPGLGHRYFGLPDSERLQIFTTDGRTFLDEQKKMYDLILVDAFVHTAIPHEIKTLEAFQAYHDHLNKPGVLAMNVISGYHGDAAQVLAHTYAASLKTFDASDIFLASQGYSMWLAQNFVLVAQTGKPVSLKDYIRYDSIQPPEYHLTEVLHDESE